ncbi:hypothetical protein CMQ_1740 [Grosmannia clavigera kw1407]|uniref:Uncharacterized protein n=1 Tax=Grosmannia clavigera (strain kw1407 / UAMH 11150) TaxID=655863 RepID=F0XFJ3_GROCL|nr:uncharacterized protein CMQ_1740 [Grosmannia clavigera kw1407]EFX04812.1 hypothetical protein CMQ_1740 [Grosmannia clavigera kw1407]
MTSIWLREPDRMLKETGHDYSEIFHESPSSSESMNRPPKVEVKKRVMDQDPVVRWSYLAASEAVDKDVRLLELNGEIEADEQITIPWDFRLPREARFRMLRILGLGEEDNSVLDDVDEDEYSSIARGNGGHHKKKAARKPKPHALSPTSTGHATNSRAASEGHLDDFAENDKASTSSRSKPPSRDMTPAPRQGSFDTLGILTEPTDRDKRKVAMVEVSFRRLEQQPPKKKKRLSDGGVSEKSTSSHTGHADGPEAESPARSSLATATQLASSNAVKDDALVKIPPRKAPDLRVQMPQVPAFSDAIASSSISVATPVYSSSKAQSPLSAASASPFGSLAVNGAALATPSPVKKKMSLSDYTKSRKAAGGRPLVGTSLKPSISGAEEPKSATSADGMGLGDSPAVGEKPGDASSAAMTVVATLVAGSE